MSKFIDRTGEIGVNNQGLNMEIIGYRKKDDIDIQFEDGYIAKNREYGEFKKGTIKKGTKLFVGADKKFFHTFNGKMLFIEKDNFEVADGVSVTGLAEWIYNYISCRYRIDEMLESEIYDDETLSDKVNEFIGDIAESLEEIGFYDYTGNTL